ncbi:MAG: hypothetical protein LBT51_07140 [Fusobacteriaceae bacterium]|jgi:hypothetical protein|nr:hypothetical protein [Fusobacteriaceae bacterium]
MENKIRRIGIIEIIMRSIIGIIFLFGGYGLAVSSSKDVFQKPSGIVLIIAAGMNFVFLIKDTIKGLKASSNRTPNEIIIQVFEVTGLFEAYIDINIDNEFPFSLGKGSEKIINIPNGKHIISATWDNSSSKKEFEINNDGKLFTITIGTPPRIKER